MGGYTPNVHQKGALAVASANVAFILAFTSFWGPEGDNMSRCLARIVCTTTLLFYYHTFGYF